jgi:IS5 family transposase
VVRTAPAEGGDLAGAVAIGARSVWIHRGQEWTALDFATTLVAATAAEAIRLVLAADGVAF